MVFTSLRLFKPDFIIFMQFYAFLVNLDSNGPKNMKKKG